MSLSSKSFFLILFALYCNLWVAGLPLVAQVADEIDDTQTESGENNGHPGKAQRLAALLEDPALFAPGETRVYSGKHLEAIDFHVGGIGGGAIRLDGHGRLRTWQIFNNLTELPLPDSFFAIRTASDNGLPVVRALNTVGEGPFQAMESLTFTGEYPFANYIFKDADVPVQISMEAYNPLIPLDSRNSSIPVAIFNFHIKNTSDQPQSISLLQAQQNAVGFVPEHKYDQRSWNHEFDFKDGVKLKERNFVVRGTRFPGYGKNYNVAKPTNTATRIYLKSGIADSEAGYGDMAVALLGKGSFSAKADWSSQESLHADFLKDGEFENKNTSSKQTAAGETSNSAACVHFQLAPGESRKLTALIAWHFPNGLNGGVINKKWSAGAWGGGGWGGKGNYYATHWDNAEEVLKYTESHLTRNEKSTRDFHRCFYSTTLPYWAKDRIANQLAILKSKTMFWIEDGYVGGWEGTGPGDGSCAGNCAHVWHYAQAHARLFPEVARRMTEQQYAHQHQDGGIPYRQPKGGHSADAQAAAVLQAYRDHLLQDNDRWLRKQFPEIKKAMEFFIETWDADRDGRLSGGQHNTLDCTVSGNSSWIGSLYAAALRASAKMATLNDEPELAASYEELSDKAIASHLSELWNGQYFIQKPDAQRARDYDDGSALDQLLGQWWASQLNLGPLYPEEKIQSAMASVFKYNFRPDFQGIRQSPREFVKEQDAGLQMITWPLGKRPRGSTSYADEVMSGFEYSTIATMLRAGLQKEAFVCLKAINDRYTGALRYGYRGNWGNWGFSGNPFGDDECGKMYSRALSSWSVLLAYQGFEYDGPAKHIGFHLPVSEENHRSFFTTAEAWGTFEQKKGDAETTVKLEIAFGKLALKTLSLKIDSEVELTHVTVDGKPASFEQAEAIVTVKLPSGATVRNAGESLHILLHRN